MKIKIEKYLRKKVNEISKQSPGKSQQNNGKFNDRNLMQIQELTTYKFESFPLLANLFLFCNFF